MGDLCEMSQDLRDLHFFMIFFLVLFALVVGCRVSLELYLLAMIRDLSQIKTTEDLLLLLLLISNTLATAKRNVQRSQPHFHFFH